MESPGSIKWLINCCLMKGPFMTGTAGWLNEFGIVGLHNYSYKPITNTAWVRARLSKLQKGCTRLEVASDKFKVYQLLARGQWFSPGTPASSTTKTCRPP